MSVEMKRDFENKKVVVTGVASGIGLAQAKLFIEAGAIVFGVDIQTYKGDLPENFSFFQLDASNEKQVQAFAETVGTIDVLLNTAGILDEYRTINETDYVLWQKVLRNNLDSMYLMTKAFLPVMQERKNGVILNMSSIAGTVGGGGGVAYTASKHAVSGFTKQLALDEAKYGIQVIGIAPGAIETPMNAKDFEGEGKMAKQVAKETPQGRWATPEEVARLTLFLASPDANYMQGSIVTIDGGWTAK